MRLNAPKFVTWLVALGLAVLGIIGYLLVVTNAWNPGWLLHLSFWIEVLAVAILAASTAMAKV